MKIVLQGLRITTACRYLKMSYSKYFDVIEDEETSCMTLKFPRNYNSKDLIDKRVEVLSPCMLSETDYIRIINPIINLNGLKIKKLVQHDFTFTQLITKDISEFILNYDEHFCQLLIPKVLDWSIDKYIKILSQIPYIEIIDTKQLNKLCNYYSINLTEKDAAYKSINDFVFNTKSKYTKYILSPIDVQSSFIKQLSELLKDYGLELISLPIDKNTHSLHRVTYRFTDLNKQVSHKSDSNPLKYAVRTTSHIEFTLSTPDLVLFNDFRTKFQNLDLISDFTEFYTRDKVGRNWISNVVWTNIDTSFNQEYNQDEQQNIAFEARFSADINYYTVYDEMFYVIIRLIRTLEMQHDYGDKTTQIGI